MCRRRRLAPSRRGVDFRQRSSRPHAGLHLNVHPECNDGGPEIHDLRIPMHRTCGRRRSGVARCKYRCKHHHNAGNSGAAQGVESRTFPLRHRGIRMEPPQGFEPCTYALRVAAPRGSPSGFAPVSAGLRCHRVPPRAARDRGGSAGCGASRVSAEYHRPYAFGVRAIESESPTPSLEPAGDGRSGKTERFGPRSPSAVPAIARMSGRARGAIRHASVLSLTSLRPTRPASDVGSHASALSSGSHLGEERLEGGGLGCGVGVG